MLAHGSDLNHRPGLCSIDQRQGYQRQLIATANRLALVISSKDLYPLNVRLGGTSIPSYLVLHWHPWTFHCRTILLELLHTRGVHDGFYAGKAASLLIRHFYSIQTQSFRHSCAQLRAYPGQRNRLLSSRQRYVHSELSLYK